jgi:hypothetical protein
MVTIEKIKKRKNTRGINQHHYYHYHIVIISSYFQTQEEMQQMQETDTRLKDIAIKIMHTKKQRSGRGRGMPF